VFDREHVGMPLLAFGVGAGVVGCAARLGPRQRAGSILLAVDSVRALIGVQVR